jgi:hypothetical protein
VGMGRPKLQDNQRPYMYSIIYVYKKNPAYRDWVIRWIEIFFIFMNI